MKAKSMIKVMLLPAFLCLLLNPLIAQEVTEKKIPYKAGQQINFILPIGKVIKISGWNKDEISITASVNINSNKLNEAYHLEVQEGSSILIEASLDEEIFRNGKAEDCHCDSGFQSHRRGTNSTVCIEILYEINVPRLAPLTLETISADVEATGLENSSQIKSISGFIDFSWPSQKEVNLQLKSVTGELYTDLSFEILNRQESPPTVGYMLKGKKGNGGPVLDLETISNDIYLRKE